MGDLLLKNDFFEKLNQRIWNFCKVVVTESKCEENQPWKHPLLIIAKKQVHCYKNLRIL